MTDFTWNEGRVEELKTFWAQGLSASQISNKMPGATRNAIIGKVHRLGLSGRAPKPRRSTVHWRHRPRPDTGGVPSLPVGQTASPSTAEGASGRPSARVAALNSCDFRRLPETPRFVANEPAPMEQEEETLPEDRISVLELREDTCRWPLGDPRAPDFGFCGKRRAGGKLPYCEHHTQMACVPLRQRRAS